MAKAKSSFEDNVFINCPFDKKYKQIFNAIVFTIHDAGFIARCSREVNDSGRTRLRSIISIIAECKYGIHDISRIEVNYKSRLPRFNMPFECGLFWGNLEYGSGKQKEKRILVLDSQSYRYQASLSDIAGQDIQSHTNDPTKVIDKIRTWLRTNSGRTNIPGGKAINQHYVLFQKELPAMLKRAGITQTEIETPEYYPDYIAFIVEWLKEREAKAKKK